MLLPKIEINPTIPINLDSIPENLKYILISLFLFLFLLFTIFLIIPKILKFVEHYTKLKHEKNEILQKYQTLNISKELQDLAQNTSELFIFKELTGMYVEDAEYRNALIFYHKRLSPAITWMIIKNARTFLDFDKKNKTISVRKLSTLENITFYIFFYFFGFLIFLILLLILFNYAWAIDKTNLIDFLKFLGSIIFFYGCLFALIIANSPFLMRDILEKAEKKYNSPYSP